MQLSYKDNERSGSLLTIFLVFAVVFSAGFGFLFFTQGDANDASVHPQHQSHAANI